MGAVRKAQTRTCGPAHHVKRRGASGPDLKAPRALPDEDLETVDAPAAPALGLTQELGAAVPVHQVDHARVFPDVIGVQGQFLERRGRVVQADRRAVDEHLGGDRPVDRGDAEIGGERVGARRACGSRPRPRRRRRAARTRRPGRCPPRRARARSAARARRARRAGPGRRCCRRGSRPSPGPNVSVFAAPIARASSEAVVASASAASLCGIVTLTPAKPAAGQPGDRLGEVLGRDGHALVDVRAVEAGRGERRVLHRGRAAVIDRPAEDAQAAQAHGPTPPSRSAAMWTTTPGGGSSIGGNFTSGPRYVCASRCEQLRAAALDDPGAAVHDEVLAQAHRVRLGALDRQRHARVAHDVVELAARAERGEDDVVALEADPDEADLRAAVGRDRDEVRERVALEHRAGRVVISNARGPCRRASRAPALYLATSCWNFASVEEKAWAPFAARPDDVEQVRDVRGVRGGRSAARPGLPIGVGGRPRRLRVLKRRAAVQLRDAQRAAPLVRARSGASRRSRAGCSPSGGCR